MALRIGGGLQGPGDLRIEGGGGSLLGGSGGGGAAPQWSVGAPHVFAIAGMQRAFENLSDSMDQRAVTDFMIQTQQQLAADYDDPDTGQFNTRKGAAATGMTQEFRERMRAYWDEEAPKHLNERQRAQIAAPMAQLMLGQAQKIAAFEANNQYQDAVQRLELAEYNAINLAASGDLSPDSIGFVTGMADNAVDSKGKLLGWSPEYTEMHRSGARDKIYLTSAENMAGKDPINGLGMWRGYKGEMSPAAYQKGERVLASGMLDFFASTDPEQGLALVDSARAKRAGGSESYAGVDMERLSKAVMLRESGGKADAISPKGARGLMQLMPKTQEDLEQRYGISGDTPEGNFALGKAYLKELIGRYDGNLEHALMAYNWGMGNVDAYIKTGRGANGQPLPEETRKYVPAVMSAYGKADLSIGSASEPGSVSPGKTKQLPPSAGLENIFTVAELAGYRDKLTTTIKAREKTQVAEAAQAEYAALPALVKDMPFEQWDHVVLSHIARSGMPREVGMEVKKLWDQEKDFQQDAIKANDAAMISSLFEQYKNLPPGMLRQKVNASRAELLRAGLSPHEGVKMLDQRLKDFDVETPENIANMNMLYSRVADGAFDTMSPEQLRSAAYASGLTEEQTKKVIEFKKDGGQMEIIRKNMPVIKAALDYYADNKDHRKKIDEYDYVKAVGKLLPADKPPTQDDIYKAVGNLFKNPGLLEAAKGAGTESDKLGRDFMLWRPDVDREVYARAESSLRDSLKRQPSEDEVLLYLRREMGVRGGVPVGEVAPRVTIKNHVGVGMDRFLGRS